MRNDPAALLEVLCFNLRAMRRDLADDPETLAGVDAGLTHLEGARVSRAQYVPMPASAVADPGDEDEEDDDIDPTPLAVERPVRVLIAG